MGNWWPEVGDPPDECCPVDWGEYGFSVSVFSFGASGGGGGVDEFDEVSCGNDMVGDDDVSRIGEWLSSLPEVTPEVTPEVIDWTFWFCSGEDLKSSIGETAFGLWAEEFSNEPDDVSDDDEHGFDDGEPTITGSILGKMSIWDSGFCSDLVELIIWSETVGPGMKEHENTCSRTRTEQEQKF